MKKYIILKRKEDCVLLKAVSETKYRVRDIENDDIYIGSDAEHAEQVFNDYNLNDVRKERKKIFERWLDEYAEA